MRIAARQTKAGAHDGHVLLDARRMGKAFDETAICDLWVAQNIGHAEYLAGRHAGSVQHVSPCRSRTTHQCGFDLGFQDGAMRQPTFARSGRPMILQSAANCSCRLARRSSAHIHAASWPSSGLAMMRSRR